MLVMSRRAGDNVQLHWGYDIAQLMAYKFMRIVDIRNILFWKIVPLEWLIMLFDSSLLIFRFTHLPTDRSPKCAILYLWWPQSKHKFGLAVESLKLTELTE